MLHLNCFAIEYFATFLFSVSETSKKQKAKSCNCLCQSKRSTETIITPHQSKVLNSTTKGSYKSRFLIQNLPVINERKYLYKKSNNLSIIVEIKSSNTCSYSKNKIFNGLF